jgi:SnoaL-like protein
LARTDFAPRNARVDNAAGHEDSTISYETYASFIGPLSTTVVVGWDSVRKAWRMRFGQFDRVTISMDEPHIRINGHAAWAVGMEKVELLRKDGKTISNAHRA